MNTLIVSETLGQDHFYGDVAFEIIRAAKELGHKVTVISQTTDLHIPGVEILSPFRNWGITELKNALLIVESYKPDWIQVVQPHGPMSRRWLCSLPILLQYSQIRSTRVLYHLLNPQKALREKWINAQILQLADTVTTPPTAQLPKKLLQWMRHPPVVMPYFRRKTQSASASREKFFLIPDSPLNWSFAETTARELKVLAKTYRDYRFVVCSSWGTSKITSIKGCKQLLADLPIEYIESSELDTRLAQCESVILSCLNWEESQFYLFSQKCMNRKTQSIINRRQQLQFQPLWNDGENCHVVEDLSELDLSQSLLLQDGLDAQYYDLSRIYGLRG